MQHSYERIRRTMIDRIADTRGGTIDNLRDAVAEALKEPEGSAAPRGRFFYASGRSALSSGDSELFVEAFWDLFREGFITLGTNADNPNLPWFRASRRFDEKIREEG